MGIMRTHIHRYGKHFDGMQAFYLNALMRSMVFAMVGIFVPLYIYKLMMPILGTPTYAIVSVAVYYLVIRSITLLVDIPSAKIIERIGFRWSVMTSVMMLAVYLYSLRMAEYDYRYLVLAAVMMGLSVPFYWIARGSVIAIESKSSSVGKQMGWLAVLERVAGVLGPISAGLMIERWGFSSVYMAAGVILLLSAAPLFSMPHHVHRNGVSLRGYLKWLTDRRFFHQAVGSVAGAMDDYAIGLVWPLAIFLMGIGYSSLGGIFSLITAISIVVRYVSGVVFDKLYKKHGLEDEVMLSIAAVGTSIAWLARLFVGNVSSILLLDGGTSVFGTTWRNVKGDYDVLGAKRMHEIAYYTYKQMTYSIGVIVMSLLWIVGAWYGVWRELLFVSASVWVLMSIVQARESNLK